MITVRLLTITCLVAALLSSIAMAQDGLVGFKMPSGNIYCMLETPYNDNGLRCDMRQITNRSPPKPASCEFAWGKYFAIVPKGKAGVRICVSDTVYDPKFPTLAYGTEWYQGDFLCKSATTGLTCINAAGHGFMLSEAAQTLF